MAALFAVALLFSAALPGDAVRAPTSLEEMRASLLKGDLVTIERGRAIRSAAGEDVTLGSIALLDDISRLVRCLPLGPVPSYDAPEYSAARTVIRLERVRMERMLK